MALGTALVDRARLVNKRAAGRVVDGATVYAEATGEWFKCRLELGRDPKSPEAATEAPEVVRAPSLLYGIRDVAGEDVVLTVADRLEVVSRQLGEAVWDVQADPQPLRKKRRVIGFQTTLRRVVQHGNPG